MLSFISLSPRLFLFFLSSSSSSFCFPVTPFFPPLPLLFVSSSSSFFPIPVLLLPLIPPLTPFYYFTIRLHFYFKSPSSSSSSSSYSYPLPFFPFPLFSPVLSVLFLLFFLFLLLVLFILFLLFSLFLFSPLILFPFYCYLKLISLTNKQKNLIKNKIGTRVLR